MSHLSDHELDQLLRDVSRADRVLPKMWPQEYTPIAPRMIRLLQESKELRDQAAERQHMAQLEHGG